MCAPDLSFLRACCLILCLVAGTRQLSISEFAVPKLVEVGNNVELKCSYTLGVNNSEAGIFVKWWFTPQPWTGEEKVQLYQRGPDHIPLSLQHKIDVELKDNNTLVLLDVKPRASGIYECEVSDVEEDRENEELLIFTDGSGPQLNVSEIEDGPDADEEVDVLILCTADDVAPLPDLSITINGKPMNTSKIVTGPDNMGYYDVLANWTASKDEVDGAHICCELIYEDPDVVHPPYVATSQYLPSGAEVSTMETPADTTEAGATPESLLNAPGEADRARISALLLSIVVIIGCATFIFKGTLM